MNLRGDMELIENIKKIPKWQKYRYLLIIVSCLLFFSPFMFIPKLFNTMDFCGTLCLRRFYLYYPGMSFGDLSLQARVSIAGAGLFLSILLTTFFFGRIWCSHICPVGGFPEMVSRMLNQRIKIEYRHLPQVSIRYGYFGYYLVMMPMIGISACNFCNFVTIPRIFEAMSGGKMGLMFLASSIGAVNLALIVLLGFFASKGRAFCAFMCPIGAVDGIVNRIGARFRFTRKIRVERERCTGCTACAQACMCGAIKMVDKKSTVDQFSCMSCHECVDVCRSGAIEYLVIPPDTRRHRKKIDEVLPPLPVWTGIHRGTNKPGLKGINWQRIIFAAVMISVALFIIATQAGAGIRKMDPDGCLSCHGLPGLEFVDENGVLRSSYIDESNYYASIHGSVPCTDCHRKIKDYPHKVEDGEVDCAESCHIKEPSKEEKYSHKKLVDEYKGSAHGKGWTKGFTGGNRLREVKGEQDPSCRWCHTNSAYITEEKMQKFKESFINCDRECGTCHQGKAWRGQFGGHILRRVIGGRWSEKEGNGMCNDNCHADRGRMGQVEIKEENGEKRKAGPRFIMASMSYDMTLHGKLVDINNEAGASCIECHSPTGYRHDIRRGKDPKSSTHADNLPKTCGAKGCHTYTISGMNEGFVKTDMHSLDLIPPDAQHAPLNGKRFESSWTKGMSVLLPLSFAVAALSLVWAAFIKGKGKIWPFIGGGGFQRKTLKREPKKAVKKPPEDKADLSKQATWLIIWLSLAAPAMSEAKSPYLEMMEKSDIAARDIADAEKKLREHKEVKPLARLPLKPFHERVDHPGQKQKKGFCTLCHSDMPHRKNDLSRSFLNMHAGFMACETCHFRPKEMKLEYRWFPNPPSPPFVKGGNKNSPLEKGGYRGILRDAEEKIYPFYNNEPVPLSGDHPYGKEVKGKWEKTSISQKAELRARIHKPLSEKGPGCQDCHKEGEKMLDLKALGFPQEKITEIEQDKIGRYVGKLKKGEKIRIRELVD